MILPDLEYLQHLTKFCGKSLSLTYVHRKKYFDNLCEILHGHFLTQTKAKIVHRYS